jgi:hypothetical protein
MQTRWIANVIKVALIAFFLVMPMPSWEASTMPSINSTSQNRAEVPLEPVVQKARVSLKDFQIVATNDLGMHCGDLTIGWQAFFLHST